jgi:hypothetical protein
MLPKTLKQAFIGYFVLKNGKKKAAPAIALQYQDRFKPL